MVCSKCGAPNEEGRIRCAKCAEPLQVVPAPPPVPDNSPDRPDAVETFVPYRNVHALVSYYLGLFSLFPCLGFPMAIVAIVCGTIALKRANADPRIRGKAHALVGLVMGGLVSIVYILLIMFLIIGYSMS